MCLSHLILSDLSYSYNDTPIFEHINETFESGKLSILMSPSGSGKSTLLSLIAGLLPVQSGNIAYPMASPRFSMVFQDNRLLEQKSILCNLRLANPKLTAPDINEALTDANLHYPADKKVSTLSGGEKRRIAILRALWAPCDILLMDEPFTGLDDDNRLLMMELVKKMAHERTALLVTHNKSEAEFFNCRISTCLS